VQPTKPITSAARTRTIACRIERLVSVHQG
jgi:hypothetical protein